MEEDKATNQFEESTDAQVESLSGSPHGALYNKYLKLIKDKSTYLKISALAVISIFIIAGTSSLYFKLIGPSLDGQSDTQYINFTYQQKEDILKSLSSDSIQTNVSSEEKHKELDQLAKQSENTSQLRDFEKVNILKNLSR